MTPDDEKEIRFLLRGTQLKKPPVSVLQDYENQVWDRIKNPGVSYSAFPLAAAAFVLALALAGYGFWILNRPLSEAPPPSVLVQSADIPQAVGENAPEAAEIPQAQLDTMARDLLILQWLGEDGGLLEDWDNLPLLIETALPKAL